MKRVHEGEKNHKCDKCKYASTQTADLKAHMKTHDNGDKASRCKICPFIAANARTLRLHEMKHTGEKPYKCNQCDYSTLYNDCFRKHMRKHERTTKNQENGQ